MSNRLSLSLIRSLSYSAGIAFALSFPLGASAEDFTVSLNKTQVLHLPGSAATVVIGNPAIADITVHSTDTLFIVGRGYGQTNIIVLDEIGQTIMDANILVKGSHSGVRVMKIGTGQETYSCTPYCLPAPTLGDTPSFVSKYSGKAKVMNTGPANISANNNGTGSSSQTSYAAVGPFAGPPPGYENDGFSSGEENR